MEQYPLIRTIYLYLFSLVGLFILFFGCLGFVNMALKAWVFTQADEQQRIWDKQPPMMPIASKLDVMAGNSQNTADLTAEEKALLKQWIEDYSAWKERSDALDPVVAQRHRDAAQNLAFIIVGLPLYLYHWGIIRQDNKRRKDEQKEKKNK